MCKATGCHFSRSREVCLGRTTYRFCEKPACCWVNWDRRVACTLFFISSLRWCFLPQVNIVIPALEDSKLIAEPQFPASCWCNVSEWLCDLELGSSARGSEPHQLRSQDLLSSGPWGTTSSVPLFSSSSLEVMCWFFLHFTKLDFTTVPVGTPALLCVTG